MACRTQGMIAILRAHFHKLFGLSGSTTLSLGMCPYRVQYKVYSRKVTLVRRMQSIYVKHVILLLEEWRPSWTYDSILTNPSRLATWTNSYCSVSFADIVRLGFIKISNPRLWSMIENHHLFRHLIEVKHLAVGWVWHDMFFSNLHSTCSPPQCLWIIRKRRRSRHVSIQGSI